jgi:hypothetical protein
MDLCTDPVGTNAASRSQDERAATMEPSESELEESPDVDRTTAIPTYIPQPLNFPLPGEGGNGAATPVPRDEDSSTTQAKERHAPNDPEDAAHDGHATPEAPNPYDAALALHACVPDGEKVEREALLADAARELGYPNLSRNVRRALNKALSTENNAGRLRTDWECVWRPRR